MSSLQQVQDALVNAGLEIYQRSNDSLHIAERVRLHIMDSGVRVRVASALSVEFTARMQRSDAPSAHTDELFDRVRLSVGEAAVTRGYEETSAEIVEVKDPVDAERVLDVWHEVTYLKQLAQLQDAVEEVRWALDIDKYVQP